MKLEVCLHESLTEDSEWQYGLIITHWSQGTTKTSNYFNNASFSLIFLSVTEIKKKKSKAFHVVQSMHCTTVPPEA